ncbi:MULTISPECIES: hypothetical protein [Streptomyces]|uniref:maltokinase N-terminal cap-like domain-containing protein n=1 Tax=Streptomyces sp. MBT70 TaxID=1488400 RepID=UPI00190A0F50|nr:hypothetical protein [Streptomyces sp. MBT70]MBK3527824.1 hypothetical protein [Streptomyces sp. MBT70]GGR95410.1 hypothetical protein GCM10010236_57440 [Streptomyces eurythermus]
MTVVACESCLSAIGAAETPDPVLEALRPWLAGRRWFAHEDGCLRGVRTRAMTVLHEGPPTLLHLLVDVRHDKAAEARRYQLLLGIRPTLPPHLRDAAVARLDHGRWEDACLYDATADPELMAVILREGGPGGDPGGPRLTLTGAVPATTGLAPRLLTGEQSNTSIAFGDRLILKVLRSPRPGPHPETEILGALTAAGSARTPRLAGWLHTRVPGEDSSVLGVLAEFVDSDGDGWELATRHAARYITGDGRALPAVGGFTGEAHSLGRAVAGLHRDLARCFPPGRISARAVADRAGVMCGELAEAAVVVPQLQRYSDRLRGLYGDYARFAARGRGITAQRGHGDLHLGQALHTADGWKITDFEGEPDRPLSERTAAQHVMRDVAGMLRSFDYAAQHALAGLLATPEDRGAAGTAPARLRQARRAQAWAARHRRAFCAGYASAGGCDPRCHPVLLRAFEAEKAVYEAVYEARHRPEWLHIPLAALRRLTAAR